MRENACGQSGNSRSCWSTPAYASFEEEIKGSLKEGKLADIVVLSKDVFTILEEEILNTDVVYTILGGKIIYSSEAE